MFSTRNEATDLAVVGEAFALAGASIAAILGDLGVEVSAELEQCGQALAEAVRAAKQVLGDADEAAGAAGDN